MGNKRGFLGLPCTRCSLADFDSLLRIPNVKQKLINKCIFGFIYFNQKGEAFRGLLSHIILQTRKNFIPIRTVHSRAKQGGSHAFQSSTHNLWYISTQTEHTWWWFPGAWRGPLVVSCVEGRLEWAQLVPPLARRGRNQAPLTENIIALSKLYIKF